MKIKNLIIHFSILLVLFTTITSCGSAHGTRKCDCPKFSTSSQPGSVYTLSSAGDKLI